MGVGVEWTWDTEILFSSSVCTEEVQEVRRTGSGGARTWLCPWHQHLGAALLSFPLIPLVPRMLGGTTVNQAKVHNFVSGPAAHMVGKESRIFATSIAHRCPNTLLYHSGERPLRSARQM